MGDPIEVKALSQAMKAYHEVSGVDYQEGNCALGAVKTNIGHLEAAAGIAGLIKILLAFQHGTIPKNLNLKEVNPYISLEDTPFYLSRENHSFKRMEINGQINPLRACLSSFGFGGVNSFVVLEEYSNEVSDRDQSQIEEFDGSNEIFLLSAKTENALIQYKKDFYSYLDVVAQNVNKQISLKEICSILSKGRSIYSNRFSTVVSTVEELMRALSNLDSKELVIFESYKKNDNTEYTLHTLQKRLNAGEIISNEDKAFLWTFSDNPSSVINPVEKYKKLPLPTYPFEKYPFWIKGVKPEILSNTKQEPNSRILSMLNKCWVSQQEDCDSKEHFNNCIIFLPMLNLAYKSLLDSLKVASSFLMVMDDRFSIQENIIRFNFNDYNQGVEAAEQILQKEQSFNGILDFSDLMEWQDISCEDLSQYGIGRISFLQQFITKIQKNPINIIHLTYKRSKLNNHPQFQGSYLLGYYKNIPSEHQFIKSKSIDFDSLVNIKNMSDFKSIIHKENNDNSDIEIAYYKGKRYISSYQETDHIPLTSKSSELSLLSGVYLVTGATGDVGKTIVKFLLRRGVKKLILMGSRYRDHSELEDFFGHWEGVEIKWYFGPLTDFERLEMFLSNIESKLGTVKGIFHCAGMHPASIKSFVKKQKNEILKISEPKVEGTIVLDRLFRDRELDFVILFSSISSVLPELSKGLVEYSAANSFLDSFAEYKSNSKTNWVVINWSRWEESQVGKIQSNDPVLSRIYNLTNDEGTSILSNVLDNLTSSITQICPIISNEKISSLESFSKKTIAIDENIGQFQPLLKPTIPNENTLQVPQWLVQIFVRTLSISEDALDLQTDFSDLGVDSILIADIVNELEKEIGMYIEPDLILRNPSVTTSSKCLISICPEKFDFSKDPAFQPSERNRYQDKTSIVKIEETSSRDIAVIGMACNFPGAENLEKFELLLSNKICSVTEVPSDRIDINQHFSAHYCKGKTYSKWGGFIDDIDQFDSEFFKIDREHAKHLDPLIKQFLNSIANTIFDAGYDPQELQNKNIGIFAGARMGNFHQYLNTINDYSIIGTSSLSDFTPF